ncbi:YdaS family helix-turn-helix protein [Variovorax paradoxus]|uniref:YdaS family helix-turn-helix protein n=1 Tax=Variovorax paradoxus TaxID=34073 RepID=UPI0027D85617|nr:YdaS family helix-turn-helix protein [Variovorax paradoxus]
MSHTQDMRNPVLESLFERRGSQIAVAVALDVSKQTVNDWRRQGFVAPRHAAKFEEFTGIAREQACPVFPWGTRKRTKQKAEA